MKRIALLCLLFYTATAVGSEKSYFANLGAKVSSNCEARSQDVKTAVHMRDEGATIDEVLKKLQRPKESWSVGNQLVDQIFQLNDKSAENFYQFSLHTCQVYYWKLVQDNLCPEIFPEDKGANCLKSSSRTAKEMMLRSFRHLSNK